MKYHPDRNPGDTNAAESYAAVSDAYEVLSDRGRRAQYDATGGTPRRTSEHQSCAELMSIIAPLIFAIIESFVDRGLTFTHVDIVSEMRIGLTNHAGNLQSNANKLARMQRGAEEAIERITVADGEENLLAGSLRTYLQQITAKIAAVADEAARVDKAKKYLNTVKYRTDVKAATDVYFTDAMRLPFIGYGNG